MEARTFYLSLTCFCLVVTPETALRGAEPPAKAPEVLVARPVAREVADHEEFTGRTEAPVRVDLRARVTGFLVRAIVEDGANVKEGDLLFEIDQRPYRAQLDTVVAALTLAESRLKQAIAAHKRTEALFEKNAASREELDKALGQRDEVQAQIQAAKAAVEVAKLNLAFTHVTAPVSGTIGKRLIDPGNLVKADDSLLGTLVTMDPLHVYFDVDERTLLRLRRQIKEGDLKTGKIPVAIGLPSEEGFGHRAVLDFADNRVDPVTGTISVRAVLPNKDRHLVPGLFVRARLTLGEPRKVLLVPAQAVLVEEGERFVFVVNDKDVIERRPVVVGGKEQGRIVVTKGLKAEDRVVVGRLQGLRPGMAVRPREEDKPAPRPADAPDRDESSAVPSARGQAGPGIQVTTVYPGANAQVVSDTVRAPIEQEVGGIEWLRLLRSRCTGEGRFALALAFQRGVDPKSMQLMKVLVQNRVALALPQLPDVVKMAGVDIKQGTSGVQLIVNLVATDGRFDSTYLSNYANIQLKDELARVGGVGEVTLAGASDYGLRIWIDRDKLAALGLNAGEVVRAIDKQKLAGEMDPEKLADVILKADGEGRVARLKDVARLELGASRRRSQAALDSKPVVALVIRPTGEVTPPRLRAALAKRLAELRERLPQGLDLNTTFDFTTNLEAPSRPANPEYLLLDLDLPVGISTERRLEVQRRCEALLLELPGVQHTLALSENPFDLFGSGPCILVLLSPAQNRKGGRDEIIGTIRARLDQIKEMTIRLRDLSGPSRLPQCGYPIDLAVHGPELDRVREWARLLAEKLGGSKKLTDVYASSDSAPRLQWTVDVDRKVAATLGVSMEDVMDTLRLLDGSLQAADINRFGRTWRVEIQADAGDRLKDIAKLKIRNARGQMIPLGTFVAVRQTEGPLALDFLNSRPMVQITANLEPATSADQGRKLCETLAEELRKELRLSAEYRLTWLQDTPGPK